MDRTAALDRADQFLLAATHMYHEGLLDVAFADARTACELAVKCILKDATGIWYRTHGVGSVLSQHGLVPEGIDPGRLERIVRQARRGEYESDVPMSEGLVEETLEMAERLIEAAQSQ